jgi:hypothetical protein
VSAPAQQQVSQGERAQKVCADRQFKAIDGVGAVLAQAAGIIDQDVDIAVELVGERAHRREIGEIKFGDRRGAADLSGSLGAQFCVADRQDHVCARACEKARGSKAYPVGCPGHDDALAGQVAEPARRPPCRHGVSPSSNRHYRRCSTAHRAAGKSARNLAAGTPGATAVLVCTVSASVKPL